MALTFLGIGAHKAGTTWLHRMLGLHPEIGLPQQKEMHFWDREWPAGVPVEGYEAVFQAMPQAVRGEITPAYAILPRATIGAIHTRYPRLKSLFILRNPIERAWSHARMGHARNFDQVPADVLMTQRDWFVAHFRSAGSLSRGDYEPCLLNWRAHYGQGELLLLLYDQMVADARAFLKQCYAHLGADPSFADRIAPGVLQDKVYPEALVWQDSPSPLPEAVPEIFVKELSDIYAEKIGRLSRLLDIDLRSKWLAPYSVNRS